MSVMLAMRDDTDAAIKRIQAHRVKTTGINDSKARIVDEAVKKLEREIIKK